MSVVLHHSTCFLISDETGDIEASRPEGLYFEDVRCLSTLRLTLDGARLVPLAVEAHTPTACELVLSNAAGPHVAASTLVIRRRRSIDAALHDTLELRNFGDGPCKLTLRLAVDADFADIYAVKKKALSGRDGGATKTETAVHAGARELRLWRQIGDTTCETRVTASRALDVDGGAATFVVELGRGETWSLRLDIVAAITHRDQSRSMRALVARAPSGRAEAAAAPTLDCDHPVLADAYRRAAGDMVALRLKAAENLEGDYAIAAGIPWYMALFGRDSLIASYQSLLHDPALAHGTLTALARLQGTHVDAASEEQPGRILHEYRRYLSASTRRNIPKFPYYGTIDATPLFLVTLSEYTRTTGDLALARTLWPNVARAVDWIERYGDRDGDGFVEYATERGGFLVNEGWKDSVDSVRFADGRLARQPIALVEVQGYVADAFARVAELHQLVGDGGEAARLSRRADELRQAIAARYWLPARDTYAEALDGDKQRVDALTSNPGHLLWSGVVDGERARRVADTLLGDALFSGWGVRTMGASEGGYNPVSYHNGSVWPHDNSLLLAGLVRYRLDAQARRLAEALVATLAAEDDHRFPELLSGIARDDAPRPVAYPTANKPQAWASGAVLLLVRSLLGLDVDAARARVTLRPLAIAGVGRMTLRGLPIAGERATIDVSFGGDGPRVDVDGLGSRWSVHVEPSLPRR